MVLSEKNGRQLYLNFRIILANWSKRYISPLIWRVERVSCLLGAIAVLREWGTECSQRFKGFYAGLVIAKC